MENLSLEQELLNTLQALQKTLRLYFGADFHRYGLSQPQLVLLLELTTRPDQPVCALSDATGIQKGNITAVCKQLEARGLVRRERCLTDNRQVLVHLTDEGRAIVDAICRQMRERLSEFTQSQTPDQLDQMRQGLVQFRCGLLEMQRFAERKEIT